MISVGVDATGFRPISESTVAAMIAAGPTIRPTMNQTAAVP